MPPTPSFPPELIREIILAGLPPPPSNLTAFPERPKTDSSYLRTACLVNSTWKEIATQELYSNVHVPRLPSGRTFKFLRTLDEHPDRSKLVRYLSIGELVETSFSYGDFDDAEDGIDLFQQVFQELNQRKWPRLRRIGPLAVPITHGGLLATFFSLSPSLDTVEVQIYEDESYHPLGVRDGAGDLAAALRNVRNVGISEEQDIDGVEENPFLLRLGASTFTSPSLITCLELRGFDLINDGPERGDAYKRLASTLLHLSYEHPENFNIIDDDEPLLPFLRHSPHLKSFAFITSRDLDADVRSIFSNGHPTLEGVGLSLLWGRDFGRTMESANSRLADEQAAAIGDYLEVLRPIGSISKPTPTSSSKFPRLEAFHLLGTNFVRPGLVKQVDPSSRKKLAREIETRKAIYDNYRGDGGWLRYDENQLLWARVVKSCRLRGLELRDDEGVVWEDGMGLGNSIQQVMWY